MSKGMGLRAARGLAKGDVIISPGGHRARVLQQVPRGEIRYEYLERCGVIESGTAVFSTHRAVARWREARHGTDSSCWDRRMAREMAYSLRANALAEATLPQADIEQARGLAVALVAFAQALHSSAAEEPGEPAAAVAFLDELVAAVSAAAVEARLSDDHDSPAVSQQRALLALREYVEGSTSGCTEGPDEALAATREPGGGARRDGMPKTKAQICEEAIGCTCRAYQDSHEHYPECEFETGWRSPRERSAAAEAKKTESCG